MTAIGCSQRCACISNPTWRRGSRAASPPSYQWYCKLPVFLWLVESRKEMSAAPGDLASSVTGFRIQFRVL